MRAVDALENRGVAEPVVRAHVEHPYACAEQRVRSVLGGAVWQAQDRELRDARNLGRVEARERRQVSLEPVEGRQGLCERLPRPSLGAERDEVEGGVQSSEPKKLGPRISGSPNQGGADANHRLLNWKRRRAPARPYFLRSTMRASRVMKPARFSAGRKSGFARQRARVTPWRTAPD